MLVDCPQICWHGGEGGKSSPILSLDTHPLALDPSTTDQNSTSRAGRFVLATAGTDAEVRLWVVNQPTEDNASNWEQPELSGRLQSFVASLGGHQRGVNVVRFSPDGLSLASASDGGTVVIWSVESLTAWSTLTSDRDTKKAILRGATEDIYDVAWSPDSVYISCGSIDRRAHVWEVATKRSIATLEDHANYVQGAESLLDQWKHTTPTELFQVYSDGETFPPLSSAVVRSPIECCSPLVSCVGRT